MEASKRREPHRMGHFIRGSEPFSDQLLQKLTVIGGMIVRRMLICLCAALGWMALPASACSPVLNHTVTTLLDEKPVSLCSYAGKVILVVNTASYCGFTSQYGGLEKLYERYREKGLVVLGFPSNDFGEQEPDGAKKIADFCEQTYGVKFPMFSKAVVKGPNAHPFYVGLAQTGGQAPGWNFHKYLIDRQGRSVTSYSSRVAPDDRRLVAQIETLLGK